MAAQKPKEKVAKVKADEPREESSQPTYGHLILNKSDDPRAKWYVAHTYSGQENRVAEKLKQRVDSLNLKDYVLEVMVPTEEKIEIRSGRKQKIREKLLPGYILVKMIVTDESWLAVRTTVGITGFVGVGNQPTPLADEEVANIQKFVRMEAPKFKTKFSVGEAVKIVDGPFTDFLGTVNNLDETKGKVQVLVSIFGRETPVELDFLQVSKI